MLLLCNDAAYLGSPSALKPVYINFKPLPFQGQCANIVPYSFMLCKYLQMFLFIFFKFNSEQKIFYHTKDLSQNPNKSVRSTLDILKMLNDEAWLVAWTFHCRALYVQRTLECYGNLTAIESK